MAQNVQSLSADLDLDIAKYLANLDKALAETEAGMARLRGTIAETTSDASAQWAQQTDGITVSMDSMIAAAAVGFARFSAIIAGAFTLDAMADATVKFRDAQTSIRMLGRSAEDNASILQSLTSMAIGQGQPIEALAKYWEHLAQSQRLVHASTAEILAFEDGTVAAFRADGLSATQAAGQMTVLVNALRSGTFDIAAFNSLLDASPTVLQAVAAGLQEAGGDIDRLRQLADDGKISAEAFFRAFLAGRPAIDDLQPATSSASEAMSTLKVAIGSSIDEIDRLVGISDTAVAAIGGIAHAFGIAGDMARAAGEGIAIARAENEKFLAAIPKLNAYGVRIDGLPPGSPPAAAPVDGATPIDVPLPRARRDQVTPISIDRYPVPLSKTGGSGGSGSETDAYDRATEAIERRTAALRLEEQTVGMSAGAREKAKAMLDLERAAEEAGLPVTDALTAKQKALAEALGTQADATEKAKEALRQHQELEKFVGTSISGYFSDIISGSKNAEQALMNVTKRLADAALQAALLGDGPLGGLFGAAATKGAVGGLVGALFGAFKFADGGIMTADGPVPLRKYAGGGITSGPQMALFGEGSTPEAYVPVPNGRIPVALSLSAPPAMAPAPVAAPAPSTMHVSFDLRGANGDRQIAAVVQQGVTAAIAQFSRSILPGRIVEIQQRGG